MKKEKQNKCNCDYYITDRDTIAHEPLCAFINPCHCRCHKGPIGMDFTRRFKYCAKCMDFHQNLESQSLT